MALTTVTLLVKEKALPRYSGSSLDGVIVRVFSMDGETFVTQGTTDDDGQLVLDLEDATTYWVRFFREEYAFDPRLAVAVDSSAASNTFDVEGQNLAVYPPSATNYLCRASGYVRDGGWAPAPGVVFQFSPTGKPRLVAGQMMVQTDVIVTSDNTGWVDVELVRNGSYDLTVAGLDDIVLRIQVPDTNSCSISELVWPFVASLFYSETSVTVAEGGTEDVTATVTLSSGTTTPFEMDNEDHFYARSFVRLEMTDPDIARFEWGTADTLQISGRAAGTTTLTATVLEGVEADRVPDPSRTLATLTITVTG